MPAVSTIVLTGGTGFLGSHLARRFLADGYRVAVIARRPGQLRRIGNLPITSYPPSEGALARLFVEQGPVHAVVHTATCYGRNGESQKEVFEANTAFPLRLLDVATQAGVPLFVNTDTTLPAETNAYSLSKSQFRAWGEHIAARGHIRFVNVALEHFFGPGDDDGKFVTHVIRSCLRNVPELGLTLGEQQRDFIYIDDVVDAYSLLLSSAVTQTELYQEYPLGSGETISVRNLVEMVHRLTGSCTQLKFGALPYRDNEAMYSVANTTRLQALGWCCRYTLEDGLCKTVTEEQ